MNVIATLIVVAFGAAYLFGFFFAVRREYGSVTLGRLATFRAVTPLQLLREIIATSGKNLRRLDHLLFSIAYLIVTVLVALGVCVMGMTWGR
jgi:hypothetical protein